MRQLECMVSNSYRSIERRLGIELTEKEVRDVINSFKLGKAPGADNIPTECFRFIGNFFKLCLTKLYNAICKYEIIPSMFQKGVIVPVPKGETAMLFCLA